VEEASGLACKITTISISCRARRSLGYGCTGGLIRLKSEASPNYFPAAKKEYAQIPLSALAAASRW